MHFSIYLKYVKTASNTSLDNYCVAGRVVNEMNDITGQSVRITNHQLKQGAYTLSLMKEEQVVETNKLLVQ